MNVNFQIFNLDIINKHLYYQKYRDRIKFPTQPGKYQSVTKSQRENEAHLKRLLEWKNIYHMLNSLCSRRSLVGSVLAY